MKQVIFAVLLFSSLSCHLRKDSVPVKTGLEGQPIASFTGLLTDSTTRINTADIPTGKPVILLFFSPYCPFCRAEVTDLVKNIVALRDARLYLFTNYPLKSLKQFSVAYHLEQYTNIVAAQDYNNFLQSHYNPVAVPFTVVFDREKKLKNAFVGRLSAEQIEHVAGLN